MKTLPTLLRGCMFALIPLLAACGSTGDRAYKACMAKVEESLKEAGTQTAGAEVGKEFLDAMRTAASASCEAIREACDSEPDGMLCKSAQAELGS